LWWQQERKARKAVVMAEQAQQQAAQSESGLEDSKKPWTRRPGNWTQVGMPVLLLVRNVVVAVSMLVCLTLPLH
jgi:hypothetical protein